MDPGALIASNVMDVHMFGKDGYQRVRQHLGGLNPGDGVTISVLRAGERISLTTTLGESD